jgi:AraC-like DNA-binding protein
MLTFDTATIEQRERANATVSVMSEAAMASHIMHEDPGAQVYLRMHQWRFGAMTLVKMAISGVTVTRTPRQTARDGAPVFSVGVMSARVGVQVQDGEATPIGPATVYGMEVTRPYRHESRGPTKALTVMIPAEDLGLPLERMARARAQLDASPLRGLFLHHVRTLADQADRVVDLPEARMIEAATLSLTRALLASASGSDQGAALNDTLVDRVRLHILEHVRDPRLSPASIAAAHHVSVRHLYKVCAAADLRLEQLIISERLAGARAELATLASRRRTIAAIATSWGFSNASHFTHRFREAYGLTPRDWQDFGGPASSA